MIGVGFRLSRGGSPVWTPSSLTPAVWLRSDSRVLSGANVTQATDLSGNSKNATPPGTAPTLVTADADFGGLDSFSFSSAAMVTPSISLGAFTIAVVAKYTGSAGYLWVHNSDAGTDGCYCYGTTGASISTYRSSTTSAKNLTANWAIGSVARTIIHRFDGTHAGHVLRINGVDQTLSNVLTGAPGSGAVPGAFRLFANQVPNTFATGKLAEAVVIARSITDAECVSFETYARSRYNHY